MINKYEDFHMHVGYYNGNHDLEGIFFKRKINQKATYTLMRIAKTYN